MHLLFEELCPTSWFNHVFLVRIHMSRGFDHFDVSNKLLLVGATSLRSAK